MMKRCPVLVALCFPLLFVSPCPAGNANQPSRQEIGTRPSVYVTRDKVQGLRSVDEVQEAVKKGYAKQVWERILAEVEADLKREPLLPTSMTPGRRRTDAAKGNPDWLICHQAGQRVQRAALACLLTDDTRYRDEALRQMAVLFDLEAWPQWRDMAHRPPADLRTGMLSRDLAVAYDWLHPYLDEQQRRWVVDGIDRRGIQPFWRAVDAGMGWVNGRNNWTTVIVGGLGIAGMALGPDHPDSERLIEFSLSRMSKYLQAYGPAGEFNESVGYAGATRLPVAYFMAHWYYTDGRVNRLAGPPFVDTARWYSYLVLPPGHLASFGDGGRQTRADLTYFAPIAAANRDGVLQWFYQHYPPKGTQTNLPWMLLWFDAGLPAASPEGRLPHGRAFHAHGAAISSRTNWEPGSTPIVIFGKAGVERYHQHHDAGQVCIDGYGQQLIVDLGSPPGGYPKDYGEPTRYKYYNASSWGHNVLVFGGREMAARRGQSAPIVAAEFDDEKGGYWQLDLTKLYDDVNTVRRTVVHLNPNIAVVLDDAELARQEEVSLRWHTSDRCGPSSRGRFTVEDNGVHLAARIVALEGEGIRFSRSEHEYRPPYDRERLGSLLVQRRESFVEARMASHKCRLLTLFAVFGPGETARSWEDEESGWWIDTSGGSVRVTTRADRLEVVNEHSKAAWIIDMKPKPSVVEDSRNESASSGNLSPNGCSVWVGR